MKKLLALAGVALVSVTLVGCGVSHGTTEDQAFLRSNPTDGATFDTMHRGRMVHCTYSSDSRIALRCTR